ncbi:DNA binding domain protein, excisionase family [Segniliparus rotundus DSM 44985]|uniref:DNA binding domain protein, excisionase family n=1 Tax=Segniliparus rotundus (strain ATCC BAA-972 / CDC 1076 / CIP 108378 / DSM 44985 / JCM 13578) TaxID=640132 RepID=D6Z9E8_SEGRD|nr:helix-turn-helix domain-containing protein [Segniliparus rotundus]ADG98578.1 DNA binding domain protein, excisionase family [Segniliparus rotundus DSM 44985]
MTGKGQPDGERPELRLSPRTYSPAEAATVLGCSTSWLEKELRARRAPGSKLGKRWRLTEADVEAVMRANRREAACDANPWGLAPGSIRKRRVRGARG